MTNASELQTIYVRSSSTAQRDRILLLHNHLCYDLYYLTIYKKSFKTSFIIKDLSEGNEVFIRLIC